MAPTTISVRKAADIPRYAIDGGSARTHFSIPGAAASVHDRFGALTVFNDDVIGPSKATQPRTYAYVDVITYVVDGYVRHDDTLGSDFVLQHGDVERFSFGSGAGDMMKNGSDSSDLRSIVLSMMRGIVSVRHRSTTARSSAARSDAIPAMPLHQRRRVAVGLPGGFGDRIRIEQDYGAYMYAISGSVGVGDMVLAEGDVLTVTDAADLNIFGDGAAHALVVVVPLTDYEHAPSR